MLHRTEYALPYKGAFLVGEENFLHRLLGQSFDAASLLFEPLDPLNKRNSGYCWIDVPFLDRKFEEWSEPGDGKRLHNVFGNAEVVVPCLSLPHMLRQGRSNSFKPFVGNRLWI